MKIITHPAQIKAVGEPVKIISEFIGKVNSATDDISIAKMISPEGWSEPGQTPAFIEYTIILKGVMVIETKQGKYELKSNQAVIIEKDEWVKYSTPYKGGAEYIAICRPTFSPERVHRD